MNESLNIEQSMQTVQRLSPRQVQFVRLLEMTGAELEEEVRRQLDDNPALEAVDNDSAIQADDDASTITEVDDSINQDPDDDPADYRSMRDYSDDDSGYARQIAEDGPDLYTSLLRQLGEMDLREPTRQTAAYIIGNIDENGYVTRTLSAMRDDIEIATGLEVTDDMMHEAFDVVRRLDPAGVGAVDLRDCLLLQIARISPTTLISREAHDIVNNYFDLLSKKHYDRLQAQVGITDRKELQAALDLILSLNPKPGSSIAPTASSMRISHITPDVAVERSDDGRYTVSLLSDLPQLQVERSFTIETADSVADSPKQGPHTAAMQRQAQAFVKLKRDDAEAFISALQQRANTLTSVTEAIVRLQPGFFETGETSQLRPMILKDVASVTGLDQSVISRATAGKYVATNTGTYPLKMFFSEAPKDNSDASTHQILHVLQEVIDQEDKSHPMSDEALREAVAAKGHDVARRTITKYREKLGIPVGRLRKEL